MADALDALLRFVHVLSAVLWMGGAGFQLMVLVPTVRSAPAAGGPLMRQLVLQGRLIRYMMSVAGTAILTGLILFWSVGAMDQYPTDVMGGLLFHLGVAAGLTAFLVAILVQVPLVKRMRTMAVEMGDGPPGDKAPLLAAMQARMAKFGWMLFGLLTLALLGMVTAQNFLGTSL